MSRAGYPSLCTDAGITITPLAPSARWSVAANGRAHVQHLADYDASRVTLTHTIEREDVEELMAFWDTTRSAQFDWTDPFGTSWVGEFSARPSVQHLGGAWYTVTVDLLLRRLDQ